MKKTIAVDMDNVLVDIEQHFIDWYEKDFGVRISKDKLIGIPEIEAFPNQEAVKQFLYTPGFFRSAPVMEGAIAAMDILLNKFEVYIVSAAMEFPQSLSEKVEWLNEYFPSIHWKNIVLCGDKSIIHCDYLIDDYIKNLDPFKGQPLLFSAGHNANHTHHKRLNNWNEVLDYFNSI
jgi:5'(3')-deoxyribonucleotidase